MKRQVIFCCCLILASLGIIPSLSSYIAPGQKIWNAPEIILQNEKIRFEFEPTHGGLSSMFDKTGKIEHIQKTTLPHTLWSLTFAHGMTQRVLTNLDVAMVSSRVEKLTDGTMRATFEWHNLVWALERLDTINNKKVKRTGSPGALAVKVTVDLPQDSGIAAWRISVDNDTDMWGMWDVDFPSVNGFLTSGAYDVARPSRPGILIENCAEKISAVYRGNDLPMQFLCAMKDKSGVYMASHDPEAWFKTFFLEPGNKFAIKTYVENMGVHGSDYKAPFPVMLGVYQGSWIEGCKIYRQFAVTTPWASKGRLSQRAGLPKVLTDIGLWLEVGASSNWQKTEKWEDDSFLKFHIQAKKYFDVPLASHWYTWHQIPWDNNYPNFFPANPGVAEISKDVRSQGITVMPYINGRIADTFNEDFEEYRPHATTDLAGDLYLEYYGAQKGRFAVMCPTAPFYHQKIVNLVEELSNQLGANAAYIDQVTASVPKLCFNKSHGHPLGGGHWWVDGYREMLRKVHASAHEKGRDMFITSETNAEYHISDLDAFLQLPTDGRSINMLGAVYSGYTIYFGTPASLNGNTVRGWNMFQGRSFLWGVQNGRMGPDLLSPQHAEKAAFLKNIGKYRVAGKKFLTFGEFVDVLSHSETVTENWDAGLSKTTAVLPVIQGSLWKAEDGSLGVFLVNYLAEERTIDLNIDPRKYGIGTASSKYKITRISPDGNKAEPKKHMGTIKRTEKLGPSAISVFEVKEEQ